MLRDRRLSYALLSYLLAILIFGVPTCAWADEAPACQREPGRVVCTEAGFTLLTDAMLDLQKRLDACQAQPAPPPVACNLPLPEPVAAPPVSASRPLAGLGAGIASTLVLTVAVLVPMPTELRAGLSSLALSGLATSVYLVLP